MAKTKSKLKPILITILVLILIAAGLFLFSRTVEGRYIASKLTKGGHLICDVRIRSDSYYVPLTVSDVTGGTLTSGAENTVLSVEQNGDYNRIECAGGEYGHQPFSFSFRTQSDCGKEPVTVTVPVEVVSGCEWDIVKIRLFVTLDTEKNTILCSGTYSFSSEGKEYEFSYEGTLDNVPEVYISGI